MSARQAPLSEAAPWMLLTNAGEREKTTRKEKRKNKAGRKERS